MVNRAKERLIFNPLAFMKVNGVQQYSLRGQGKIFRINRTLTKKFQNYLQSIKEVALDVSANHQQR